MSVALGDEIEVTPEMIEAGLYELAEHRLGEPLELVLEDVFRAMAYARPESHGKASASSSSPPR